MVRASAVSLLLLCACAQPEDISTSSGGGPSPNAQNTAIRPAAISGGTLLLMNDGHTLLASDPDRHQIWVADLSTRKVRGAIELKAGDEPGRMAQIGDKVVVALRRSGDVAVLQPGTSLSVQARNHVCAEPRGVTADPANSRLLVACATGELVTLDETASVTRSVMVARDLRDALPFKGGVRATTFRAAKVVDVNLTTGATTQAEAPPPLSLTLPDGKPTTLEADGAFRSVATPTGLIVTVHQRGTTQNILTTSTPNGQPAPTNAYGSTPTCNNAIVRSAITTTAGNGVVVASRVLPGTLPVDVAVSQDGSTYAVAMAGSRSVVIVPAANVTGKVASSCEAGLGAVVPVDGEPTGVAFTADGLLIVQKRDPAGVELFVSTKFTGGIPFTAERAIDVGHSLFHRSTNGLSCASCHLEGRDDGRTWTLDGQPRRTQTLAGGVMETRPFHWKGDLSDLGPLMQEVFVKRMGGPPQDSTSITALAKWIDKMPMPERPAFDADQVARGKAIFTDQAVACQSCHSGALYTTNLTVNVGTGDTFQVPSLRGIAARAPFMHNGCADTMAKRFDPTCGGATHGDVTKLTPEQIGDLSAYVESL